MNNPKFVTYFISSYVLLVVPNYLLFTYFSQYFNFVTHLNVSNKLLSIILAVIYGLTSLALAIVCSDPDFDNKIYFSSITINLALSYIVLYILYKQQDILFLYISFLLIGISSWVLIALTQKIHFKAMLSLLPYGAWTTFTSFIAYFIFNN